FDHWQQTLADRRYPQDPAPILPVLGDHCRRVQPYLRTIGWGHAVAAYRHAIGELQAVLLGADPPHSDPEPLYHLLGLQGLPHPPSAIITCPSAGAPKTGCSAAESDRSTS